MRNCIGDAVMGAVFVIAIICWIVMAVHIAFGG